MINAKDLSVFFILTLHEFARYPCVGAMLIFSVWFQV